jgi:disulfide bond formation protein DsbB
MTAPAALRPAKPGAMPSAWPFALVAAIAFAAVGAALVSQHAFAMEPCPWCVLQRLIFLVIGVVALLGWAWRNVWVRRGVAGLGSMLGCAGIGAALWQHFVAARSASCNLTLADRIVNATQLDQLLPNVFEARASCADAAVNLLGVPYALWAALVFLVCTLILLRALLARR